MGTRCKYKEDESDVFKNHKNIGDTGVYNFVPKPLYYHAVDCSKVILDLP